MRCLLLLTISQACTWISTDELTGAFDRDEDGVDDRQDRAPDDPLRNVLLLGASERCDGADDDCDGAIDDDDEDVVGQAVFFVDQDDDGVPGTTTVVASRTRWR